MKRWLKRTAAAGLVAIVLVAAFILVEHVRGSSMLNRRLAQLQSQGEVLSIAALEPKRPPGDQNMAVALMALSNRVETVLTNHAAHPVSVRFVAPGRAVVTVRVDRWAGEGKTIHDWTEVRRDVDRSPELWAALRAAANRSVYDSGFDYRKGFVDFQLGAVTSVKKAVQCLHVATLLGLHEGRLDDAGNNLCALVKLAVGQKPEPLVICQLIRHACVAIAFNVTWQALQIPGWTDDQLAALQAAWTGCDLPGDMGGAFDMERAMGLDFYRQLKASGAVLAQVIRLREESEWTEVTGPLPAKGLWLHQVYLPLWRMAWIDQDAWRGLEQWQLMIERERRVRTNAWTALPDRPAADGPERSILGVEVFARRENLGWYDRLRYLFSAESFSITDALLRKTLFLQTQQQMALTATAVARYRLAEGKEPDRLEALVPRFLPSLPKDWMDGKPLRYRLRPEGGFLLYSVGEDGRDDQGDPTPGQAEKKFRLMHDGRDAVWPIAAAEAETGAAVKPN